MKKIIILHWNRKQLDSIHYKHLQCFDYSKDIQNNIVGIVLDAGYNVMIINEGVFMYISIDDKRFTP